MYEESTLVLLLIVTFASGYFLGRRLEAVARRSRIANNAAVVARARAK